MVCLSAASLDYITASATLVTNQHAIAVTRYESDPHTHVHRAFTNMEHPHHCWPHDWTWDQCVTVAQLHTGHSPLLAAYLHCIGRRDSATCPHGNGADETVEHLVLHCPAHVQARRESWPNLHYQSDPRRLWSFLERIGVVTSPRTGMRERESMVCFTGPRENKQKQTSKSYHVLHTLDQLTHFMLLFSTVCLP